MNYKLATKYNLHYMYEVSGSTYNFQEEEHDEDTDKKIVINGGEDRIEEYRHMIDDAEEK